MRILMSVTTWESARLEAGLRESGFQITAAKDGIEVFESLDLLHHPIVLLETDLPDLRWRVALSQLRKEQPDLSILLINSSGNTEDALIALENGADDVVHPRMHAREVASRIIAVASRRSGKLGQVIQQGPLRLDLRDHSVSWAGREVAFSPSQYLIFETLCLNNARAVNKNELLGQLYGIEDAPDSRVLEVFVNGMRKKLMAAGAPFEVVETVRGMGYRLGDLSDYAADGHIYPMESIEHLLFKEPARAA